MARKASHRCNETITRKAGAMKRSTYKKSLHAILVAIVASVGASALTGCDDYELSFGRERDNCDWEDCVFLPWGDCVPLPWGDC